MLDTCDVTRPRRRPDRVYPVLTHAIQRFRAGSTQFVRASGGATAVEFALVAAPFFLTLFAVLEVAMVYFGSNALEAGTAQAARLVRTGQIQVDGNIQDFRDTLCAETAALLDCDDKLFVDVRSYPSFANVDLSAPVDEDGNPQQGQFNAGQAGDVVLVRTYYVWEIYTPLLGELLGNIGSTGSRLLMSTAAFRNEPF